MIAAAVTAPQQLGAAAERQGARARRCLWWLLAALALPRRRQLALWSPGQSWRRWVRWKLLLALLLVQQGAECSSVLQVAAH